jgi:flagellin-like protein
MNNKKGISAIVATVLIILITVAAVTIIWAAIIPMISNELGGATECFDASAALTVSSDYSCYNAAAGSVPANVSIQVSRATGDFTLLGVDVLGSYEGSADTVMFNSTTAQKIPAANGALVYTIIVNSTTTSDMEFKLDGIDQASVAARVQAGQTEKLCDGSAVTEIRPCE